MKRHRILAFFDFDTRSTTLSDPIPDHWDESVKAQHRQNRENTVARLKAEFGELYAETKIQNFIDLGTKSMSVLAFHNAFYSQIRTAFVMGAYYPSLTGACALGERILNHLILSLRNDFKNLPSYKRVYRSNSFDDWTVAIDTLVEWDVLLPKAVEGFRSLVRKRHASIHFRPEVEVNARQFALDAIKCLQSIIDEQFSGFGTQPWFLFGIPGEIYIKKDWETKPFVRLVYLTNGPLVGPCHYIQAIGPPVHIADPDRDNARTDVSDEGFVILRNEFHAASQKG